MNIVRCVSTVVCVFISILLLNSTAYSDDLSRAKEREEIAKELHQEIPFLGKKEIDLLPGEKLRMVFYPDSTVTLQAVGEVIVEIDDHVFMMSDTYPKILKKGARKIMVQVPKKEFAESATDTMPRRITLTVTCVKNCPFVNNALDK